MLFQKWRVPPREGGGGGGGARGTNGTWVACQAAAEAQEGGPCQQQGGMHGRRAPMGGPGAAPGLQLPVDALAGTGSPQPVRCGVQGPSLPHDEHQLADVQHRQQQNEGLAGTAEL